MREEGFTFSWFDWFCLWYPPGWLILFNRHWQHYHADPDGWNWLEYILFLIPGGFYLALLIRWLRLGCRLPRRESPTFDPNYQKAFREEVLAPIVKYYFRGELQQIENLPETGPAIVAMNHAGMCFPWDFLVLAYLLGDTRDWIVQPLAGVSLFEHLWMIWWLPPGWSQVLGGVRAEYDEFEAAVAHKTILLYAPEGLRGPCKGWPLRFQIQTFHPSFISLSARYQIPILPVVCWGNEYLHPFAFNFKNIGKIFGLPFLPISFLIIVFILFPSMGVWAMRSRLQYYIQPLYRNTDNQNTIPPQMASNNIRLNTYKQAQLLREKLQSKLNCLLNRNEL
ncbi:1-acyl-sn-glycerol-3-phosphate acyltransferase [Aerosakkonema funiforme]|uniref:1-acyl-sn-glycerol-3-phosphate acyltransferase n=1 Tax=Aerosakkonema funiforme TaxID=1246630 RepID=UPI0035B92012